MTTRVTKDAIAAAAMSFMRSTPFRALLTELQLPNRGWQEPAAPAAAKALARPENEGFLYRVWPILTQSTGFQRATPGPGGEIRVVETTSAQHSGRSERSKGRAGAR